MKKSITIFASIILMTLSANVIAQNTVTETATASATILNPITITELSPLAFGSIVNDATGGKVVITPAGDRSFEDGTSSLPSVLDFSAATYTISGDPEATYTLVIPTSDVNLTSDGATMTVNTFLSNIGESGSAGAFDANGAGSISVGATLNVAAGQASGEYTGEFDVTVAYN